MPQPISFASRDLERELAARTDADRQAARSLTAKRDLERYYETLRRSLPAFTEEEAVILVDVNNGTLYEPHTIPLLWANVADAFTGEDGVLRQEYTAFVNRLHALTYAQCVAVVDAIERFWTASANHANAPLVEQLRAVGLMR